MLLRIRNVFRPRRDEGSVMIAVIGVMALGLVVIGVVAATVVTAYGTTSATRASVQAQAAAESGVAVARASLQQGQCVTTGGVYTSAAGASPSYSATIYRAEGSSWVRACPAGTATQVRILSTGYATAKGTASARGDSATVEAVLAAVPADTSISPSGPAIYAYNSQGFDGSGTLVSANGSDPDVMIKTGDVDCDGAAGTGSDLVVDNGALILGGSCSVVGNVWATKSITINGGVSVGGNAVGSALTINSGSVGGSAWATGAMKLSGGSSTIAANASAASLTFNSGGKIGGSVWTTGTTTLDWGSKIAGNLTAQTAVKPSSASYSDFVTGTVKQVPGTSPYAAPARPTVPNWVDFSYKPADWTGFTALTLTKSGTCGPADLSAVLATAGTSRAVVDARGCTGGLTIGGSDKVNLPNDVAIIANNFALGGGGGFTASGARRLWLINPDNAANGVPDAAATTLSIDGGFTFSNSIATMMYSPSTVVITSSTDIYGQIFSGKAGLSGAGKLHFVPVGLPGVDLATGTSGSASTTEAVRSVVSMRNVN